MAALPTRSARVKVCEPLKASGPSLGSASITSLAPAASPQPVPGKIRLNPCETYVPAPAQLLGPGRFTVLLETIELRSVTVAPDPACRPPPDSDARLSVI